MGRRRMATNRRARRVGLVPSPEEVAMSNDMLKRAGLFVVTVCGQDGTHEYVRVTQFQVSRSGLLRVITTDDDAVIYSPSGWVSIEPV